MFFVSSVIFSVSSVCKALARLRSEGFFVYFTKKTTRAQINMNTAVPMLK